MIPSLLSTGIQKDERSDDEGEIDNNGVIKENDGLEKEGDKHDTNEKFLACEDKDSLTAKKVNKCRN